MVCYHPALNILAHICLVQNISLAGLYFNDHLLNQYRHTVTVTVTGIIATITTSLNRADRLPLILIYNEDQPVTLDLGVGMEVLAGSGGWLVILLCWWWLVAAD